MKNYFLFLSLFFCAKVFSQVSFQEHTIVDDSNVIHGPRSVFAGDLDNDGDLDLLSASPKDNEINWYPNIDGSGTFNTKVVISSDADGANYVIAMDIDGDNHLDVISTSQNDNKIAWYKNIDGKGNFSTEKIISTSILGIRQLVGKDLDADGDIDIISAGFNDDKVVWFENLDGIGTFSEEKIITEEADGPTSLYADDMDSDGDADILLTTTRDGVVAWYENVDGKGSFSEKHIIKDGLSSANSIYSNDLDNDGDKDVIVISTGNKQIFWFENLDGQGNFSDKILINNSEGITNWARGADLDKDGDIDIIASGNGFIAWFENVDGKGTFSEPSRISKRVPGTNQALSADVDGDGNLDVIAGSQTGDFLAWYRNKDGLGDFDFAKYAFQNAISPHTVCSTDLDNDGDLDVLATSAFESKIFWYKNLNGSMDLSDQIIITTNSLGYNVKSTDIDGDGDLDILSYSLNPHSDEISWYENIDGQGNFSETPKILNGTGDIANVNYPFGRSLEPADVDNDGDLDLLSTHYSYGGYVFDQIEWFENLDGKGNFGEENTISNRAEDRDDDGARRLLPVDIDGDGDVDIVCGFNIENRVAWYENTDGKGNYGPQKIIADNQPSVSAIISKDLDNDGDFDVVFTSEYGDKLSWSENIDGKGTFSEPTVLFATDGYRDSRHVNIDDLDNDQDMDILMVSYNGTVSWFENLGEAIFGEERILTTEAYGGIFSSIDDMDNDGDKDILISSIVDNSIVWFENLGSSNNTLQGKITFDLNSNGCDSSDLNLEDFMVTIESDTNSFSTFTNPSGDYKLIPNNGVFKVSTSSELPAYLTVSQTSQEINFTGDTGSTEVVNFCVQKNGVINDLATNFYPIQEARPGFIAKYGLTFKNLGNIEASGSVSLKFDTSKLSFIKASEQNMLSEGNLKFDYIDLKPFESRTIFLEFTVYEPPIVNIDDYLNFTANIISNISDDIPDNDKFVYNQVVIGSYDPNDITVLEGEKITEEESKDYLNYIIRFQNTGTASAINVQIKHDLDEHLDWTTFKPNSSSHVDKITIKDGRYVEFNFENIHLPDSTSNEKESHGYVAFKIKPKSEIKVGDIIKAKAAIYFDFNSPVITNEVSTIVIDENTSDLTAEILYNSEISCNGFEDAEVKINISGGTAPYQYQLLDDANNLITQSDSNIFTGLSAGNYIIKIIDNATQEITESFKITEPEKLMAEVTFTETSCFGKSDGEISITAIGGNPPYKYSLDDQTYTDNNIFPELPSGEYEVWVKDSNACVYSQLITISDSTESDYDGDGIGDSCDDDIDGDGILNDDDECDDTVQGETVNVKGCPIFTLPITNFTVTNTSETCRNSDNGKIEISAVATYDYTVSLVGNETSQTREFANAAMFDGLRAGIYELCITISDYPEFEQCYNMEIVEPDALEVNSIVNMANRTVKLQLKGGDEYTISHNGSIYRTSDNEIELSINSERNTILVSTGMDCQGSYSRQILFGSELVVYPNPVANELVTVKLPNENLNEKVVLKLFSNSGKQIINKSLTSQDGSFKFNIDGVAPGVYTILVQCEEQSYYSRIIKK